MLPDIFAKRLSRAVESRTMVIASKARAMIDSGNKVIDLSLGDPALDVTYEIPTSVIAAAIDSINDRKISYTSASGLLSVRMAVCEKLKKENGLSYDPNEISIVSGVKQAIFNSLFATIEDGDEVIIPVPSWLTYADITSLLGGKSVFLHTNIDSNFKVTPDQIALSITPKTKWFIITSPNNPTGTVYTREELAAIGEVLRKHPNIMIMSDEIYEYLLYDPNAKQSSFAAVCPDLKDRIITVNGSAKSHAMTGWRVGYCAGHKDFISKLSMLQSNETSNACTISQYAMVAALEDGCKTSVEYMKKLSRRKEILINVFSSVGMRPNNPDGAFYLFPYLGSIIGKSFNGVLIDSCTTFCTLLLENEMVAVTPGVAFGTENHFRVSIANSDQNIVLAADKIKKFCESIV